MEHLILGIKSKAFDLILNQIISLSISKTTNLITDHISSIFMTHLDSSCQTATSHVFKMYYNLNQKLFNVPHPIHAFRLKYVVGTQTYHSVVHVLIHEYNIHFKKGISFSGITASTEDSPILSSGERFDITYENKKISMSTLMEPNVNIDNEPSNTISNYLEMSICDVNGLHILKKFTTYCSKAYSTFIGGGVQIYTNNGDGVWWRSKVLSQGRPLNTVILKNGLEEKIMSDVSFFIEQGKWFIERGIPHKLGILFYGEPGTGKSSMIQVIATLTKKNIYYLMLDNVKSDSQYLGLISAVNKDDIIVIEDIDRTQLTQDIHDRYKISMSLILNTLDGLLSTDGRITIFTANNLSILDKALFRPGRIDNYYHLGLCDVKQIIKIYELIYSMECPKDIIGRFKPDKYSPAEVIAEFRKNLKSPDNIFTETLDKIIIRDYNV